ncbi:hypothetical protein ATCC90586_003904 [Pythium insidiosum]|nr:hypothetical protein ATCC90586_003904 [Pythium insidiosum]
MSSSSRVRVAVRVRPPDYRLPKDEARPPCVAPSPQSSVAVDYHHETQSKTFTFDHVFGSDAGQEDVYVASLQPLLSQLLDGYNVTVIAYGQTGSGKTYTVGNRAAVLNTTPTTSPCRQRRSSLPHSQIPPPEVRSYRGASEDGLIPRLLSDLFASLKKEPSLRTIRVSFLEIYCDALRDLLEDRPGSQDKQLTIREDTQSVWVENLRQMDVESLTKALELMNLGRSRQVVGANALNDQSSRSHVVYTMEIKRKFRNETKTSKLTFVDLAGSERVKKTQVDGTRLKESIQINVGLSALGNVINALADDRLVQRRCSQESAAASKGALSPRRAAKEGHVPYRSSKLTRLLRDALGGNSRTLFIACVSPLDSNAEETLNTLQYANRARNIQNKVEKNVETESSALQRSASQLEIARLQEQLQRLQQLVEELTATGHGDTLPPSLEPLLRACREPPIEPEAVTAVEGSCAPVSADSTSQTEPIVSTSAPMPRIPPPPMMMETSSQCEPSAICTEASTETVPISAVSVETQVSMEAPTLTVERPPTADSWSQSQPVDVASRHDCGFQHSPDMSDRSNETPPVSTHSAEVQASTTCQSIGVNAKPSMVDEQCGPDNRRQSCAMVDAATTCDGITPPEPAAKESRGSEAFKRGSLEWRIELEEDDAALIKPLPADIARIKDMNRAFLDWNSVARTSSPVFPMVSSIADAVTLSKVQQPDGVDPEVSTPRKSPLPPLFPSAESLSLDGSDENQEDAVASPKRIVTFVCDAPVSKPTTRSISRPLSLNMPALHDSYDADCHEDDGLPSNIFIPVVSSPGAHDSPLSVCASTLEETDLLPALSISVKRVEDPLVELGDSEARQQEEEASADNEPDDASNQQPCAEHASGVDELTEARDYILEPLPRSCPLSGVLSSFRPKSLRPMSLFRLDDRLTERLTSKAELLATRLRELRKEQFGECSISNQEDDGAALTPLDSLLSETNALLARQTQHEQQVRVLRRRLGRLHEALELPPSPDRIDVFVKSTQIALLQERVVELETLVMKRVQARCAARLEADRWSPATPLDRSAFLTDDQCRACAQGLEDTAWFRSKVLPLVLDGWIGVSQRDLDAEDLWLRL